MSKILYLDDSPDQRHLILMVLGSLGFQIETATDGEDGLHKVKTNRPDLILLDLRMPKIDGFEFLEILKQEDTLKDIPVIVVSAWAGKNQKEKAAQAGAIDFISKPYDLDRLINIIEKYLPPT